MIPNLPGKIASFDAVVDLLRPEMVALRAAAAGIGKVGFRFGWYGDEAYLHIGFLCILEDKLLLAGFLYLCCMFSVKYFNI